MACFIAPAAAAIVTTSIKKKISSHYHLEWLNLMLWGGVIMLIVDHIINREFLFSFSMLREIITVGVPMTLAIIAVWVAMVLVANKQIKIFKI